MSDITIISETNREVLYAGTADDATKVLLDLYCDCYSADEEREQCVAAGEAIARGDYGSEAVESLSCIVYDAAEYEAMQKALDERYLRFLNKYPSLEEGYKPVRDLYRHYDGYILKVYTHHDVYDEDGDLVEDNFEVERIEFGDAHELEAYCLEHELVANDREDYQINEWPDGTWLIIDAEHADYACY